MFDGHLAIDVTADGDSLTLVVSGEVDAHSAPRLEGEIQTGLFASSVTTLVIDFGGVTFLDSSGLRVVISAHRLMRQRDGVLIVRRPSETVQKLLEITQLTGELKIEN